MAKKKDSSSPFTADEIYRAKKLRDSYVTSPRLVDDEWMFIAEFGYYYGWDGVMAILDNIIDYPRAEQLLLGARVMHSIDTIDIGQAVKAGSIAALSDGSDALKKNLSGHFRQAGIS